MSMIGEFGICKKEQYIALTEAAQSGQEERAAELAEEICVQLKDSAPRMDNDRCAGEAFLPLFHYLESELGLVIRQEPDFQGGEIWRRLTGDFDVVAFSERDRDRILPAAERAAGAEINQFVCDFFGSEYGSAGQEAQTALLNNLRITRSGEVLIWRLY